ncbi:twin-arginine translocation signal domain-containing protein [Prolixibacter bellariivorans]|uniref:twin-arginine translocation signal domain-containing protein n=1 Tax=Prolixibacter bellariivorans TaxID=314319 RepID=UPI001900ED46|nr:twin-arginine translocation signal domain-containing protein [Prolixibacter bellariivorans]
MERRDFLKRAGLATAATLLTSGSTLAFDEAKDIRPGNIPRWYGFNLLAKFSGNQPTANTMRKISH